MNTFRRDPDARIVNTDFKVGDRVRAFHPRKFGVVNYGTIVAIGRKWIHVDFGPLHGGVFRVPPAEVLETVEA